MPFPFSLIITPTPPHALKKFPLTVLIFVFLSLFSGCMDNPIGLGSAVPAISKPKYLVISGILTKIQPNKLEYTHGERLDLRGLVVTIFFDYEDDPIDVAFEDFAEWGITTIPEHRDTLSRTEHHGANVVISILSEGLDLDNEDDDEEMQAVTKFLTVNKGEPVIEWPDVFELSFFQTLSHIKMGYMYTSVEGEFTWENHDVPLGELGRKKYNLTFTPEDTINNNVVTRDVEVESRLMEVIWVNPGTFQMGSPESEEGRPNPEESWSDDDEPLHTVTLTKGFYMGKYEVTQEQYEKVMGNNPSSPKGKLGLPVNYVSWVNAIAFCNKLSVMEDLDPVYFVRGSSNPDDWGSSDEDYNNTFAWSMTANGYRLPTEAEWEYACRAGTTTAYNTGAVITDNTGWYYANSGASIQEVGQKHANNWGFYDMHGNVSEWCFDIYYAYYYAEGQVDPYNCSRGDSTQPPRVHRGGSYNSSVNEWSSHAIRSAARGKVDGFFSAQPSVGFRVIRY